MTFVKPHGSTSWELDVRRRKLTWTWQDATPRLESLSADDVDDLREPLLLGAVPIKSELIREVQAAGGVEGVHDTVALQWLALVEALRDADTVVVAGYRFPPEDLYGRFLVAEGLRLRPPKRTLRIEFFELEPNAQQAATELRKVFGGSAREFVYRGPVQARAADMARYETLPLGA